jgi:hypothetical protein
MPEVSAAAAEALLLVDPVVEVVVESLAVARLDARLCATRVAAALRSVSIMLIKLTGFLP